jgi:ribonuclease P protein component
MGMSYAHPLIVLVALPNELRYSRFAVSAGRSLGKSVKRNRAKRLIREALRPIIPYIMSGWDVILVARNTLNLAAYRQVQEALITLFERADLLSSEYVRK